MENSKLARAQELASRIEHLQIELAGLDLSQAEMAALPVAARNSRPTSSPPPPSRNIPKGRLQPHRQLILDILAEVGQPMLSRDIQAYARAKYGVPIEATRFGSLRRSEMDAFDRKSQRPVWIAYGLTGRGDAVKRLLTRSDLPLQERVVGPLSGRRLFFSLTARLCEIAHRESERLDDPAAFKILVADHARDLPGLQHFQKGRFPLVEWLDLARQALSSVEERDLQDRRHIAMRLTMLDEKSQLFGTEFAADDHSISPPITQESLAR